MGKACSEVAEYCQTPSDFYSATTVVPGDAAGQKFIDRVFAPVCTGSGHLGSISVSYCKEAARANANGLLAVTYRREPCRVTLGIRIWFVR